MRLLAHFAVLTAATVAATNALADDVRLRAGTVLPIRMEESIVIGQVREGDRIRARVDGDRDLPPGTRLIGRVSRIREGRRGQSASVDLEFGQIVIPGERPVAIDAVPVVLDENRLRRDPDGRFVVRENRRNTDRVWQGALGGFLVGSALHKQLEGLIVGTVVGIAAAESERSKQKGVVVDRGQRLGALFNEAVVVQLGSSRYGEVPRIGWEGRELRFDGANRPYRADGTVMVPLADAARQMRIDVDIRGDGLILLDSDEASVRLRRDSRECRRNGRRSNLPREVVERDGVLYAPIEALAAGTAGRITLDGLALASGG